MSDKDYIADVMKAEGFNDWLYIGSCGDEFQYNFEFKEDELYLLLVDLYESDNNAKPELIKLAEYILRNTNN